MSEFKFSCPHCQQNIAATPEYSGVQIDCPSCQTAIVVPQAPAAGAPAAPAAPKAGKLSKAASTVQHTATTPVMATTTIRKAKKPRYGLYIGLGVAVAVAGAAAIFVPKAIDKYNERKEAAEAAKAAALAAEEAAKIPPDLTADEIVKKVDETYKALTSYSAQGSSVATVDMSQVSPMLKAPQTVTAKLSILLGRPDHYRFEWERQLGQTTSKGAVWSAGKGDFVRTTATATKVKNMETALTTAGGTSGTLGIGLIELFFQTTNSLAADLKNYAKTNNETLAGRKCYVLTGKANSQNMVFWIHKDDFLIAQMEIVLGGKIDDLALAGLTATQKTQAKMMEKMKGNIIDTYEDIETNKVLNADSFQMAFAPTATPKAKTPREPKPGGRKSRVPPQ